MDLFDLFTEMRDAWHRDRSAIGTLLDMDESPVENYWRPNNWLEPWKHDPIWPHSTRTVHCQIVVLTRGRRYRETSEFRAGCTGCGFVTEPRPSEMQALTEGLDHSHPGWWQQPIVSKPKDARPYSEEFAKWGREIARVYPAGWFESGGPVRTQRVNDDQPHAEGAPGGGWDIPGTVSRAARARPQEVKMVYVKPQPGYWGTGDYDAVVLDPDSGEIVPEYKLRWKENTLDQYNDDDDEWEDDDTTV